MSQNQKRKQPSKPWSQQTTTEKTATVFQITVGLAAVVLLVICCVVGVNAGISANKEANAQATATTKADSATSVAQSATKTVLALTPTPTPTLVHRITDIVTHHRPDGNSGRLMGVITGAEVDGADYRVDVTEPQNLTSGLERVEVQQDTYDIMDALYNSSAVHPDKVTVRAFGSCVDKYGNTSTCQWAVAMLTKQIDKLFNWKNLDYEQAWADYDQTEYLVSDL